MERIHAGDDDVRSCTAAGQIRRGHCPNEAGQAVERPLFRHSGACLMRGEKVKITTLALAIASAFSLTALAQSSGSSAKPDDSTHCMEGMAMPGCPQTDMQHQHKTPSKPPQNTQPQQPRQQKDMNNMPGMQHDMSGMQMGAPQQS